MKFLNFNSDSPNFRTEGNSLIWDVTPWTLGTELSEVAISSCFAYFDKIPSYRPVILSCSLIDENFANWNGIIAAGVPRSKSFVFNPSTPEFWKLDCSRPRNVIFTLKGIDAQSLNYINIVLAIR